MQIEWLNVAQLKDLVHAGQTDILQQEIIHTMLVVKSLDYDKNPTLLRDLFNYVELIEHYLS